jgi:hypothetical protein
MDGKLQGEKNVRQLHGDNGPALDEAWSKVNTGPKERGDDETQKAMPVDELPLSGNEDGECPPRKRASPNPPGHQ